MGPTRSGFPLLLLLSCSALGAGGCSTGDDRQTLDVFAASSLTDAYETMEDRFEADHPEVDIRLNLAGSSTLLRQILDGAEAHVYAPADVALIDDVADLVVGDTTVYATNQLTLVVPSDSDDNSDHRRIDSPGDLSAEGVLVARCAPGVPCGDATDRYLEAAGFELGIATEEANVRSVLLKVATGEVDAGFVYTTDALARSEEVEVVALTYAPRVELAIARLSTGDATAEAAAAEFAAYVTSAEASELLRSLGFETP